MKKIFVSTSPSLPASSNQNLPFLLLSSLYGDTLLEHWSPSPSLVWKDIAQWWRYGLGIPSFLLSNRESVGWNLWGKSVSIRKETLMTLSSWKTVFTKLVLKCTFGLLSLGWLDFFANEVRTTNLEYQYVNDNMLWINSRGNENNLILLLTQQTNLAIEEGTSIIRYI